MDLHWKAKTMGKELIHKDIWFKYGSIVMKKMKAIKPDRLNMKMTSM